MLTIHKCNLCGQISYSVTDAEAHSITSHAGMDGASHTAVRYRCPRCGLLWGHPADVVNHLAREHRVYYRELDIPEVALSNIPGAA